jgi:hypothetical protein
VGLNRSVVLGLNVYLGLFASLAALMFNCVKREDINDNYYSPYDDSEWRWAHVQLDLIFCSVLAV